MKRKTFMMLFALSMGTTAFAQTGLASGTRFGHGEDSLNCLKNISIYTEYVKTSNFKDAYTPWKAVFTEAPIAQVSTYTNGAKILRGLIAREIIARNCNNRTVFKIRCHRIDIFQSIADLCLV